MPERAADLSPENVSTLDRLVRSIDLAEGFTLFIARCNIPVLRRDLIQAATGQLAALGVEVIEVVFEDEPVNVRARLRTALETTVEPPEAVSVELPVPAPSLAVAEPQANYAVMPKRVVFIVGLEAGIPYDQPNSRVLAELNLGRDLFPRDVPCPLVIWLPDYAVTAVARHAPDFWAWRSGVFEFETGEIDGRAAFEQYIWRDQPWYALTNLTPEARLLRRRQLESLLDDYRGMPNALPATRERAAIFGDLGDVCSASQDSHTAIAYYERALAVHQQLGEPRREAALLNRLGSVYAQRGDHNKALEYYEKAMSAFRHVEDRRGEAAVLNGLAGVYVDLSSQHLRFKSYDYPLPIVTHGWDQDGDAVALETLEATCAALADDSAELRQAVRHSSQAASYSRQALRLLRETNDSHEFALTELNIAWLEDTSSDLDQALAHWDSLLRYVLASIDWLEAGKPHDKLPVLQEDRTASDIVTDRGSALASYEMALSDLHAVGDRRGEAIALKNIGGVYSALGDKRKALDVYEQAVDLARQIGDRWLESMGRSSIARIYEELGELGKAEDEQKTVVELDEAIEHPDLANAWSKLERIRAKRQKEAASHQ